MQAQLCISHAVRRSGEILVPRLLVVGEKMESTELSALVQPLGGNFLAFIHAFTVKLDRQMVQRVWISMGGTYEMPKLPHQ